MHRTVFISGATGYLGKALGRQLAESGVRVRGLARPGSGAKVPENCSVVLGDPFRAASFQHAVEGCDTLVHLTGTSRPAPWKTAEFERVDWRSLQASLAAAEHARVRHLVYVSVAHPAPVMKSYIRVRKRCEQAIVQSGIPATILRPWYVLGPGHRWPLMLLPLYWLCEQLPATCVQAQRLGLVNWEQMRNSMEWSVLNPAQGIRILDVPAIRDSARLPVSRMDYRADLIC